MGRQDRLPGMELIARGRDADVFALDESRVLRRYRHEGRPTDLESRLMTHLTACGYPVPKVYEVTDTDMVLGGSALRVMTGCCTWTCIRATSF